MATPAEIAEQIRNAQKPVERPASSVSDVAAQIKKSQEPIGALDTAKDVALSAGSGVVKGVGDLASFAQAVATPWGLVDTGTWGAKKAVQGADWLFDTKMADSMPETNLSPDLHKLVSKATLEADTYEPKTNLGRYAKTTGEFIPGALVPGGPGGLVAKAAYGALAPALASEGTKDLLKDTAYEKYSPYLGAALAIASPYAASKIQNAALKAIAPATGVTADRIAAAKVLDDTGVTTSAGQFKGNQKHVNTENSTAAGQETFGKQSSEYTDAVLTRLRSGGQTVTSDGLKTAKDNIYGTLKRVGDSVNPMPAQADIDVLGGAIKNWRKNKGQSTDLIPEMFTGKTREIYDAFKNGKRIDGKTLRKWRTELGDVAYKKGNANNRDLYHSLIKTIDGMVDSHLISAGRLDDLAELKLARNQYRDYLAVEKAAKKSLNKPLDPNKVHDEMVKQGLRKVVHGERGEISDITNAVRHLHMKPNAAREPGLLEKGASAASSALGSWGAYSIADKFGHWAMPAMQAAAKAGEVMAGMGSGLLRNLATTPRGQKYLKRQSDRVDRWAANRPDKKFHAKRVRNTIIGQQVRPGAEEEDKPLKLDVTEALGRPGYIFRSGRWIRDPNPEAQGGRVGGFKAGGRISSHEQIADQLVAAADRAKKAHSRSTEPLLRTPDDMVAKALQVANRSI